MEPNPPGSTSSNGGANPNSTDPNTSPPAPPIQPVTFTTFQPVVVTPNSPTNEVNSPDSSSLPSTTSQSNNFVNQSPSAQVDQTTHSLGGMALSPEPASSSSNGSVPTASNQATPVNSTAAQSSPLSAATSLPANAYSGGPLATEPHSPQQFFSSDPVSFSQAQKNKPANKKFIFAGSIAAALLFLGCGYIFGIYLPNKPANVFKTGLNRSGDNLAKLVNKMTDKQQLAKLQNTEITATLDAKATDFSYSGALGLKLSKSQSDGSLDIAMEAAGEAERKLNIKFLSDLPEDKKFPNIYFQVNGLRSLGLDEFIASYLQYDGKWIAVESDYLESINSGSDAPKNRENVTSEEVASFVKTISDTSNEYLLTADKDKAVLENKAFIGKEVLDGMRTYRYEVNINKTHAQAFCKTLTERLVSHALYKKMANRDDADVEEQKKDIDKDCENEIKNSVSDDTKLELWVDAKYKLVHKIRIYDKKSSEEYTEFGQVYKGGDNINFFINYHEKSSEAKFSVDVDMKAYASKGSFTWKSSGDFGFDVQINFAAKPHNGEVKVEKPAETIKIQDIMGALGYVPPHDSGPTSSNSSGSYRSRAKDTERETDIKALHAQLEAYYAMKGIYPAIGDLNNTSWRAQNMRGLDSEALRDPDGLEFALTSVPSSNQYSYITSGCALVDNGCTAYTLVARLSTGATYERRSLN